MLNVRSCLLELAIGRRVFKVVSFLDRRVLRGFGFGFVTRRCLFVRWLYVKYVCVRVEEKFGGGGKLVGGKVDCSTRTSFLEVRYRRETLMKQSWSDDTNYSSLYNEAVLGMQVEENGTSLGCRKVFEVSRSGRRMMGWVVGCSLVALLGEMAVGG